MRNQNIKKNSGFIALMSAIIISAILMLIATSLNQVGFYNNASILDSERKTQSNALANSCLHIALLHFAENSAYAGNETVTVGSSSCFIGQVTQETSQVITTKVFYVRGIYQNAYTNLKVRVNAATFAVISTEETTDF